MESDRLSSPTSSTLSSLSHSFDVSKFLMKMRELKGTFSGRVKWSDSLEPANWKSCHLEITEEGSLRPILRSTDSTELGSSDTSNNVIIKHLQDCKLKLVEEPSIGLPVIKVATETSTDYFCVSDKAKFESLLCSLIWWSALRPKGIFNKISFESPPLRNNDEEPTNLLVSQLIIFGPLPPKRRIPVFKQLTRPNFLEKSSSDEGWFPAMGVLKSNGTLDLLLQSDGSLIYTLDITILTRSEIRLLDSSLQNDNYLFIGKLPVLRQEFSLPCERKLILNGPLIKHLPGIILKFSLPIDVEDWLVSLKSFALAESLSLTGAHNSNKLRVSNRFRISIVEGDFKGIRKSLIGGPPSLYVELSMWGHPWGRTAMVRDTETPFWREEFSFNENVKVSNVRITLKQRNANPNKEDETVGFLNITQELINDTSLNKETRLPVMDAKTGRFKIGTICIRIISSLKFILPASNFGKFESALTQVCPGQVLSFINDLPLGADMKFEDISSVFLDVFQILGREDDWFAALIDKELADVDGSIARNTKNNKSSTHIYGTLFRGNSILTRSMESFFIRVGKEYLDKSIGPPLRQIIGSGEDCEVDPNRIREDDPEKKKLIIEANHVKLLYWVEKIWSAIYNTSNDIPMPIKNQMRTLRKKLELMCIEDDVTRILNCVSGMLFLRFFCPVILNPKLFNFVRSHLNERSRRTVTLISKVLLNLSNLTVFANKEPYMAGMNCFIEDHREEMLDYTDKVTQKKLDFSSKKLKLASSVARPKLLMDANVLAELPTNPYLIDRYLRETQIFVAFANYTINKEGSKGIPISGSLDHISKNITNIEISLEEKRAEIGDLEFEKITTNNVEVFGNDLLKYLEQDSDQGNENTTPILQSDGPVDAIEQLERESILLLHKVERLKRALVDYEHPTENMEEKIKYGQFLADNTYYTKTMDIMVDTQRQFGEDEALSKLFSSNDGYSHLLDTVVPRLSTQSSGSTNISFSDGSGGLGRKLSFFRSNKTTRVAIRDGEERETKTSFTKWFKRVK